MAGKLIKELLIDVKQKGLTTVVNDLDKLEAGLENAAAGAELLDSALKPIPESLKSIITEAKELDDALGLLSKDSSADKLETQFDNLDDTMHELIGSIVELQDSITSGFNRSTTSATSDIKELLVALERLDDTTEGVARRTKILDNIYDNLSASSGRAAKGVGAVGRQGRGQTRDFAALAKIAGPVPIIYATIAANVFALSEAFRVLSGAAQLNRLEEIGTVMGTKIGIPIQSIAKDIQETTGYVVSYDEALRQASSAATFGFTTKQITDMTLAARRASVVLGVDMEDALNRITRGVSKLEVELLDELGITVRLEEAYSKYAAALGISATALTGYQKQQAYLNAVLAESERRQSAVDPYLTANGWELLGASIKAAAQEGTQWIAQVLEPMAKFAADLMKDSPADVATKNVKDFTGLILQTQKETDKSSFLANSFVAFKEQVEGKLPAYIAEAKKIIKEFDDYQKTIDFSGIASGTAMLPANFNALSAEASAARVAIKEYESAEQASLQLIYEKTEAVKELTEAEKLRAADAVLTARAVGTESEVLDKLGTAAKGTKQPFEDLADSLGKINKAQQALEKDAAGVDFLGQAPKLSNDLLEKSNNLMKALRAEFIATAKVATEQLKNQEEGIRLGTLSSEVALKNLKVEQNLLNLEANRLRVADSGSAAIIANQEAINVAKLKELGLLRQIRAEELDRNEASYSLLQSLDMFNGGYSKLLTTYQAEKQAQEDSIRSLELRRESLGFSATKTAEMLALELQINEAKRKGADLDAAEAIRKASELDQLAQRQAAGAGGSGELSGMDASVTAQLTLSKQLYDENKINITQYEALVKQASDTAYAANQLRIQQEAELNSLFMSRTGQQSTAAMNAEQELAYQQQLGAQFYENARSSLDAFDPAMGAMFDGLQQFTTALIQVGDTSQGVWNGVAAGIQAAAGVMSFASQKAIGDIDKQIEAEKKRDGQSEASKKKIAQLEAKKAKETEKQQRTAIIANTAVGIMSAIATSGNIYAGLALAGVVAAMGVMQLSALDSSSISDPAGASVGKLELGSRQNNIDVGQAATGGELAYIRGDRGMGSAQDFVPRARGSIMSPNVSYATGEHGTEIVSSNLPSSVTSAENIDISSGSGKLMQLNLSISALDSQSILDRAADIWEAIESEANSKGFTLNKV